MSAAASELRALLEAEAATFHPGLRAQPMPSMGGGIGVVATAKIPPGAVLARLPFRSILTVKKARLNLALAEVALETECRDFHNGQVPFIATTCLSTKDMETNVVTSSAAAAAVAAKISAMERTISPADTMTCYLILMASLYGRWESHDEETAPLASTSPSPTVGKQRQVTLRFSHENAWMGRWVCCLPSRYDNLLELGLRGGGPSAKLVGDGKAEREGKGQRTDAVSNATLVREALAYPRHQRKVLEEHVDMWRRYEHCLSHFRCLQRMPRGELADAPLLQHQEAVHHPERACTMEQFLWGFNSLMSRGFAFDEDTWAMMPYVDYFNYALEANGTMYSQATSSGRTAGGQGVGKKVPLFCRRTAASSPFSFATQYEYLFKTTEPVHPGEQILLSYGVYSDFELLLWYGFTLSPFLRPGNSLPPCAAGTSSAGAELPRLTVIRQLQSEELCRQLYEAVTQQASLPQGSVAVTDDEEKSKTQGESKEGEEEETEYAAEVKYGVWRRTLQLTYSHVFSALADTDGHYPTTPEGNSWLGRLVADFLSSPAVTATATATVARSDDQVTSAADAVGEAELATHQWALFLARDWHANADSREKLIVLKGLSASGTGTPAALGVLGASQLMADMIRFLGSHGVRRAFGKGRQEEEGAIDAVAERVAALRAVAWMEFATRGPIREGLYSISSSPPPLSFGGTGGTSRRDESPWVVSASAVKMAVGLSCDIDALLYFLAVEATDAELRHYLAQEPVS